MLMSDIVGKVQHPLFANGSPAQIVDINDNNKCFMPVTKAEIHCANKMKCFMKAELSQTYTEADHDECAIKIREFA